MQDEVLKRDMFAKPMTKASRNSGIMAGFEDMDEMSEAPEPEEQMSPIARTPQNPEILMNTLRGDMRSVDARYQELAQMVGDQAAQETPPEVLALLQAQLAQPAQGGIGALPQAQGMTPPQMGAAPQGAPGMPPQGAMPQGMESAPPFPQGASAPQQFSHGGSVHPATPDGLPPMHAQVGAFVTPFARLAQMGADKAAMLGQEANMIGGQLLSRGFPQQFPAIMENLRGPGGRFLAEQSLKYPTLTQHLGNVGTRLAEEYPRAAAAANAVTQPVVLGTGAVMGSIPYVRDWWNAGKDTRSEARRNLESQYEDLYYQGRDRSIPMPSLSRMSDEELQGQVAGMSKTPTAETKPAMPTPPVAEVPTAAAPETAPAKTTEQFIAEQAAAAKTKAGEGEPTTADNISRTKELYKSYQPMFKELLGDTGEDLRTQAALLLADAGFKYAYTPPSAGKTPASVFAEAFGDLPKGLSALAAQATERNVKINTAALQQALTDVTTQNKMAQDIRLAVLKGDYNILAKMAERGGGVLKDGGAGLVISETKDGGFRGTSIDPNNPTVQSALKSRYTLNDSNPFVEFRGEAPSSVETDKGERVKLTSTLRSLDNSLATLDGLKGAYSGAYGPGAWFSDKVNNLLVPVVPSAVVRPDVNLTDTATRISTGMNSILKNIASANDGGRVAVQEQEWARDTAKGISDPTAFFADKELAAKQFNSMEAMLRNARQQVLTQLGYESNDYVMRTPNTGTKNDPFVIPADGKQQKQMFNYLGNSIGRIQDPNALVYLKMPNGSTQAFNPIQLQGLITK